jgi:hypothetical protein
LTKEAHNGATTLKSRLDPRREADDVLSAELTRRLTKLR